MKTLVKNKNISQEAKSKKRGKTWVFVVIFLVLLAASVHFLGNFSNSLSGNADKNLQKSRFEALQNKILAKESLSDNEKAEFCQLLFQIKGYSFENCAEKTDAEWYFLLTYRAKVGTSNHNDYRKTFFEQNPTLKGKVVVHHAVEQKILTQYQNVFTPSEIHSLENLRGIEFSQNNKLHLSEIRREWNQFYDKNKYATKEQILIFATEMDLKYGHLFTPKTPKHEIF